MRHREEINGNEMINKLRNKLSGKTKSQKADKELSKQELRVNESLKQFIRYSSSPWRIVWTNFVAGIFRGLGAIIGASLVIALLVWVLKVFSGMPLVGEYADKIKAGVTAYVEETNYNDEFDRLGDTMEKIEEALTKDK